MTARKALNEIKAVVSIAALLCACVASAAETLLDIDFTNAPKSVDNAGRGLCRGVLPNGVVESFSSWSEGSCTTSLQEEEGVKFLRFASNTQKGVVQFAVPCPKIEMPGHFRLTVADGDVVAQHAIAYLESRQRVDGVFLEPTCVEGATFPCDIGRPVPGLPKKTRRQ